MASTFLLALCALCPPVALGEMPSAYMEAAALAAEQQQQRGDASLELLQRSALSFTKAASPSTSKVEPKSKPPPPLRRAMVTHYNDSSCTIKEGSVMNISAETDECLLGWNYTCSCSDSGEKMVIGHHYKDGCSDPKIHHARPVVVGRCLPGRYSDSDADIFMKVDDFGTCPCCGSTCSVYGDPHISVFDNAEVALLNVDGRGNKNDAVGFGDFWLVKSELIWVQGRYRKVIYPKAKLDGHTYLTGVAIGGAFLQGNVMLIGPRDTGKVEVINELGEVEEILKDGGMYKDEQGDLIEAHYREHALMVKDRTETTPGIYIHLPSGVKVEVNRFGKHIDFSITMRREAAGEAGVDGQCGNFNGNPSDDSAKLITARIGYEIPKDELLFRDEGEDEEEEEEEEPNEIDAIHPQRQSALTQKSRQFLSTELKVYLYTDSSCENPADLHYVMLNPSLNACEFGWNFSCACNCTDKVVIAEHHWPSCEESSSAPDGEVTRTMVKANVCMPPIPPELVDPSLQAQASFSIATTYWRLDASACPYCGGSTASCMVHGDPHITVFDQGMSKVLGLLAAEPDPEDERDEYNNDMYGWGDFWLVKSEKVLIQARYRKVFYPKASEPLNHTYLTSVAIGGPFLRGHKLIVEPRTGIISWSIGTMHQGIFDAGQEDSSFEIQDLISARYYNRSSIVPGPKDVIPGLDLELPAGVTVMVDRFSKHLDLQITLSPTSGGPGGMDGQCGNYNGDASDDTAELIDGRIGYQVPKADLLFERDILDMNA